MALSTRDVKRRISSVASTKKITKAMELVSASKMRRAVDRVLVSRAYADAAWDLALHLAQKLQHDSHPLLAERPVKRVAMIVIGSNRGLCGGFNINTVSQCRATIAKHGWDAPDVQVEYITFGKKVRDGLQVLKYHVAADYPKDDITDEVSDVLPLARQGIQGFLEEKYDAVVVVYTHFISSLRQETRVRHLVPLVKPSRVLGLQDREPVSTEEEPDFADYIFEPSATEVLAQIIPRLLEVQVFQTVLESEASEHSARMMAMRNASDAAGDMIDELTLAFNQLRQASITAEIAEIAAGADTVAT